MMRTTEACIASLVLACWSAALPQTCVIRVWPGRAPGSLTTAAYHEDTVFTGTGAPRPRHVTDPELFVYLPQGKQSARTAVIICPGGGYARLAIDHEGHDVAKWFTQSGVAGIVLKYRLPSDDIMKDKSVGPLQDVQEAIRIVRRKAKEWNIDPGKIGVMGFSAGGHVAASASTLYGYKTFDTDDTTSARPDFSLLIYGVLTMQEKLTHVDSRTNLLGEHPDSAMVERFSAERQVNARTPPAFLVHSADDPSVPVENSISYFSALRRYGIPAELHVYEKGGHGYGLAKNQGTESGWPEACKNWMRAHSLLP
jgi:acetyl esterase/lipase